jgi:hypothetical protein
MRTMRWMGLVGVAVMMACGDDPVTAPGAVPPLATVYSATGPIGATVSQFRAILGPANGGIAGEQPADSAVSSGRLQSGHLQRPGSVR